jgi:hypothetical protein
LGEFGEAIFREIMPASFPERPPEKLAQKESRESLRIRGLAGS